VADVDRTRYRDLTTPFSVVALEVHRMDDCLVRVSAPQPPSNSVTVGDTVAIHVGEGELRRYTVSAADVATFELVGFLTRQGPATAFLETLAVGDTLSGQAPERAVKMPDNDVTWAVVVGDETIVGSARAVVTSTRGDVHVVVKSVDALDDAATYISATSFSHHATDDEVIAQVTSTVEANGTDGAWALLVGEQSVNNKVRQHLFTLGFSKDQVATRTFWRPDRVGIE
jgi:NADPH-dependent ferric siderophore reductase